MPSSLQRQPPGSLCAPQQGIFHSSLPPRHHEIRTAVPGREDITLLQDIRRLTDNAFHQQARFFFSLFSPGKETSISSNQQEKGRNYHPFNTWGQEGASWKKHWGFLFLNHSHLLWVSDATHTSFLCISFCSRTRPTRVSGPCRRSLLGSFAPSPPQPRDTWVQ